mgnify:CR=1 FL=1
MANNTRIMDTTIIAGTAIEPYITGDYAGHFVYASPDNDLVFVWPPSMIQFA